MESPSRRIPLGVWIISGLTIALIALALVLPRLSGRESQNSDRLPVYGQLKDFALTNQFGQPVDLADLNGKVWIADLIFTRCAASCPVMTRQMADLQAAFAHEKEVKFISLTTDPDYDTPKVLKRYAGRFGAQAPQWWFLTGTKRQLHALAVDGLKFTSQEKKPSQRTDPEDLFIHSTIFALVDQQGRLRGVFQTQPIVNTDKYHPPSGPEQARKWAAHKAKILNAVHQLLAES